MAEASSSPATPASPSPAPPRKRRWGRWMGLSITALLVLLIAVVLLLPTLLSTGPGKNLVLGTINSTIRGTLEMSGLSLSWFGGQSMRDVTLRDPQGGIVAQVASVEAPDVRLIPAALGSLEFGTIRIRQPDVQIRQQPGQPTNLEQAIEMRAPGAAKSEPTDLSGLDVTVEVTAGRIVYESPDLEPVELSDVNATVAVPTLSNIAVKLDSGLKQGGEEGRIAADLRITDAVANGEVQVEKAKLSGTADVVNLPLTPVDRIAGQEGKVVALLGDRVTANLDAQGGLDALNAKITATTPRLRQFEATLVTEEGQLRARETRLALEVTPEAFAAWAGEGSGTLQQAFVLRAAVPTLTVPRQGDAMQFEGAQLQANVDVEEILLTLPTPAADAAAGGAAPAPGAAPGAPGAAPEARSMAVRGLRLVAESAALGDLVTAALTGTVELASESGPIDTRVEVRHLLSETQPLAATLNAKAFPVPLADAFAGQGGKLTATLGEKLDATANVTQPPGQPIAFDGTLASAGLTGPFAGTYAQDGAITFTTPKPMNINLSPAAYRAWLGTAEAPPLVVPAEPLQLATNINAAYAPLPPAEGAAPDAATRIDPARTRIALDVSTPRAVLENTANRERYRIEQLRVAVNATDLREVLEIVANARVNGDGVQLPAAEAAAPAPAPDPEGDARGGAIASTTQVRNLVAADGTLQPGRAAFTTETNARELPSALIDSLAGQGGQLAALLGATTTAAITGGFEPDKGGNLDIALRSANVRGKIPATIDKDRNVTIPQAALDVQVTPEVSQSMLKNINPLLGSAVSAEAPVRLTMSQAKFALPVSGEGMDWSSLNAAARITSKGMTLNRTGAVGQLLGLLNLIKGVNVQESYKVDISDLPMRVQQGVLSYQNLNLRLGNLGFVFGGDVNLATNVLDLQMTFADDFPQRELRNISVPLSGSPSAPIFSRESLQKALIGAGAGVLLENLLNRDEKDGGGTRGDQPVGRPRSPQDGQGQPEDPPRGGLGGLLGDLLEKELERDSDQNAPADETAQQREQRRERQRQRQERLRQQREQQRQQQQSQ